MDRDIDATVDQGLLNFLGEQGLAADFEQATVLDTVAGGDDLDQGDSGVHLVVGHPHGGGDGALHHARLGQGQGGTSGADTDREGHEALRPGEGVVSWTR